MLAAVTVTVWAVAALWRGVRSPAAAVLLVAVVLFTSLASKARLAVAHDPGQGEILRQAQVTAASDGNCRLTLAVDVGQPCGQLRPVALVGHRGGQSRSAPLTVDGLCHFSGTVTVPADGRWFLCAELNQDAAPAEVWVPIISNQTAHVDQQRPLYRPADRIGPQTSKYVAGAGLYVVGLLLLGYAIAFAWRRGRHATVVR